MDLKYICRTPFYFKGILAELVNFFEFEIFKYFGQEPGA